MACLGLLWLLDASPALAADFLGEWTSTVQNGVNYRLILEEAADGSISGTYDAGTITGGVVEDNVLRARWEQGRASGMLEFRLSPDGDAFSGIWSRGPAASDPSNAAGTWDGVRVGEATASSGRPAGGPGSPVDVALPVPALVEAPFGICPAPHMLTVQEVYVTDGLSTERLGEVPAGVLLQCQACDDEYCAIVDDNARATVPRDYVAFEYAPGASRPRTVVGSTGEAGFSGDWLVDVSDGTQLDLTLVDADGVLSGVYVDRQGDLMGRVAGAIGADGTLEFLLREEPNYLRDEPLSGSGLLRDNGDGTLGGSFLFDPDDAAPSTPLVLSWSAARRAPPLPPPSGSTPVAALDGRFQVVNERGEQYALTLNVLGSTLAGSWVDQSGGQAYLYGTVFGDTLVFHWSEDGGGTGDGNFTLSADGSRIDGSYRGDIGDTVTWETSQGTWAGERSAR